MGDHLDGPSLKDLSETLSSTFEELSNGYVAYSIAHCLFALVGMCVCVCVCVCVCLFVSVN